MKLPRRNFLHLAAGAAALPASPLARIRSPRPVNGQRYAEVLTCLTLETQSWAGL